MKKYEDLVVDGETEDHKGRQLVAGLRLLRAYGKLADRALKHIESGKDVRAIVPFLERVGGKTYRGHYNISPAAVHSDVAIPPLPDYSKLTFHVEKIKPPKKNSLGLPPTKKEETEAARGYVVRVTGPCVGVYPKGQVVPAVLKTNEDIVASVWLTKSRVSWSFRNSHDVKSGQARVRKGLSEAMSYALVRLCSDGTREVWHSQASRVHSVLRDRCRAKLELDGHAERLRREIEAMLVVNDVHAL